jgi:hypothetical protein
LKLKSGAAKGPLLSGLKSWEVTDLTVDFCVLNHALASEERLVADVDADIGSSLKAERKRG